MVWEVAFSPIIPAAALEVATPIWGAYNIAAPLPWRE